MFFGSCSLDSALDLWTDHIDTWPARECVRADVR